MNPVSRILNLKKPFVYFHSYDVTEEVLDKAKQAGKSLEIDISVDEDSELFIGHPLSFYEFKKIPMPNNLPFKDVLKEVKEAGLYVVLDCKDVRALDRLKEIVAELGPENCLFHSWVDSLVFKPYPKEIVIEPHWGFEHLTYDPVIEFHEKTGVPMIFSCRGITEQRLEQEKDRIVEQIILQAKDKAVAVNLNLPNGEVPPKDIIDKLLDNQLLTWINIDKVPKEKRPDVYLGVSDFMQNVSDPKHFM